MRISRFLRLVVAYVCNNHDEAKLNLTVSAMTEIWHLRAFVTVIDAGGFAPAARRLGVSAAAITRSIATLERDLSVRLIHRTTRQLHLTEIGEHFLQKARQILDQLAEAEGIARGAHLEPQGELAITAPVLFGRLHIAPLLFEFQATWPKVSARVLFVDRVASLIDEGFDLALRIAPLPDSTLTAVSLGTVKLIVVGSPAYFARHGVPESPADLSAHQAIGFTEIGGGVRHWHFSASGTGSPGPVAGPQIALRVNVAEVAIEAALAGHGLARILSYQVHDHIAAGRLQRVLEHYEPAPIPVHLVYPEGRMAAAKVRAFVEFAATRLRRHPALGEPPPDGRVNIAPPPLTSRPTHIDSSPAGDTPAR